MSNYPSLLPIQLIRSMPDDNVYLTFDDGPDELTPHILDLLDWLDIKATFFVVGRKAQKYFGLIQRMANSGHTVGNHSFSHLRFLGQKRETIATELRRTDEILYEILQSMPSLFRPPYGLFGFKALQVLRQSGHRIVLWNHNVGDYRRATTAQQIASRLRRLKSGQIVLLHDGHNNSDLTVQALRTALPECLERNVSFAALPAGKRNIDYSKKASRP